jgi:hypothetical protein
MMRRLLPILSLAVAVLASTMSACSLQGGIPTETIQSGVDSNVRIIVPEGTAVDASLDIGGPGLGKRCLEGDYPIPGDSFGPIMCSDAGDRTEAEQQIIAEGLADPEYLGGGHQLSLNSGSLWVALVCYPSASFEFFFERFPPEMNLPESTVVTCDQYPKAMRVELAVVDEPGSGVIRIKELSVGSYILWLAAD